MAPGQWKEVVSESGGHIYGRLRYIEYKRAIFKICSQPSLTRVLGPIVLAEGSKVESRYRTQFRTVKDLLRQIDHFDYVRFVLDPSVTNFSAFQSSNYLISLEHTLILDCTVSVDELWRNFKDKTRNVIRKAAKFLTLVDLHDPQEFMRLYLHHLGTRKCYFDPLAVKRIYHAVSEHKQGRIVTAVDNDGLVHAMIFTLWDERHYYYFLSSRDPDVADNGATSLLLWNALQHAHALSLQFDFDGVSSESRYHFMAAFGGRVAARLIVQKSTFLFALLKNGRRLLDKYGGNPRNYFLGD